MTESVQSRFSDLAQFNICCRGRSSKNFGESRLKKYWAVRFLWRFSQNHPKILIFTRKVFMSSYLDNGSIEWSEIFCGGISLMNLENQRLVVRWRHSRLTASIFQNNSLIEDPFPLTIYPIHVWATRNVRL
jgi:hypothetical protein